MEEHPASFVATQTKNISHKIKKNKKNSDVLVHDYAPSDLVWMQKLQKFREYLPDKTRTERHADIQTKGFH